MTLFNTPVCKIKCKLDDFENFKLFQQKKVAGKKKIKAAGY